MRAAGLPLLTLLLFVMAAGCSEESPVIPPQPPIIELLTILCNPLAPAPSQEAVLTAQVTGRGSTPQFTWSVSGGTLIDNGTIAVRWQAPADPGVYRVDVIAKIESVADTMTKYFMIRRFEIIPTNLLQSLYPNIVEGEIYFLGTSIAPSDRRFLGYHVYHQMDQPRLVTTNPNPPINGGYNFIFGSSSVLTSVVTAGSEFLRQQPINIITFPLIAGVKQYVSNNDQLGTTFRKNQHVNPSGTGDFNLVAWQFNKVGESEDGTKDRVNIMFRAGTGPIQQLTTAVDSVFQFGAWNYRYWRNIKPLITPDRSRIVYFVDSTETYEPCFIPLEGSQPLLSGRRALMVDSRRGIFYYAGIKVSEKTVFQWNPTNPSQLYFIGDGRKICVLDIADSSVTVLATGVNEFHFSADGKVAAIADDGVYIASSGGGEPVRIYTKERDSDDIYGVTWAPGTQNQRVVFRMVRKGASAAESYSAMIVYSVDDGRWYFATPRVPFGSEPALNDYTWKRSTFEALGGGFISPITAAGGRVYLYRSY